MKILNFKKILFLSIIMLSVIGCQTRIEPEEFDNEQNKDLPIEPSYGDDTIRVASIAQLRKAAIRRDKVVIMEPGTYTAEGTMPDDVKTIYNFSGSNNKFIFNDVTIITPTSVLKNMGPGNTHEFATYRFRGSNITFEGGTFKNTGWERPYKSIAEFEVHGNNITFLGCKIHVQGSAPYGYGDIFGKGSDNNVALYKHSAMSIIGDDVVVDGCDFTVHAFGHGIHIHGSQNTIIRNVNMVGARRLTDSILAETSGPAFDRNFEIYFPAEKRGQQIPSGQMISLTEDGIRAYLDGDDINGVNRRTQNITVENCVVDKMRGGITLAIGNGDIVVKNNTSINNEHAYSFPSNSIANEGNKGNVAYGPLLYLPYDHKGNSEIEIELLDSEHTIGDHDFAYIIGNDNDITFTYDGDNPDANLRTITVGVEPTYTDNSEETDPDATNDNYSANNNTINNFTKNPIKLGVNSNNNTVTTNGTVEDLGTGNTEVTE